MVVLVLDGLVLISSLLIPGGSKTERRRHGFRLLLRVLSLGLRFGMVANGKARAGCAARSAV